MLRDDRVPVEARSALVAGGAYVISPIDLIPGFIPMLGQLDDLLVALLGLRFRAFRNRLQGCGKSTSTRWIAG